jgi:pimeloyl-ACP methyl ester carboxylesterase
MKANSSLKRMRLLTLTAGAIVFLSAQTEASPMAGSYTIGDLLATTSGCASNAPRTGLSDGATTDGDERPRTYLLQVPSSYSSKRAYPLIFVFHGAGGSSKQSHSWGLQDVPRAAENGIFVFPQGIEFHHGGIGWDDSSHGYDMAFFDNMVRSIESSYCINASQVFVAGFSWGGDFATALACSRGDKIRAVAANSTNDEYKDKSDYLTYRWLPCSSKVLPAIRFEHAAEGDSAYPAPYFATTSKLFQSFGRCSSKYKPVQSSANSTEACVSFDGCVQPVIECSFDKSLGHKLPPNWAQDTWAFFQSFQAR